MFKKETKCSVQISVSRYRQSIHADGKKRDVHVRIFERKRDRRVFEKKKMKKHPEEVDYLVTHRPIRVPVILPL